MRLYNDFFFLTGHNEHREDSVVACVILNPSHIIYQVHFPGNPITPGVCIIQMATEILEQDLGKKLEIDVIHNVKFLSILVPKKEEVVEFSFQTGKVQDGHIKIKCNVTWSNIQISSLSITYSIHD